MECICYWNGKDQFEVEGSFGEKFKVHLGEYTCCCRRWQLIGIPCAHAIACIFHMSLGPENYIDPCYHKKTYMRVYNHLMQPLNGVEEWPPSNKEMFPPIVERLPGSLKKNARKKRLHEKSDDRKEEFTSWQGKAS